MKRPRKILVIGTAVNNTRRISETFHRAGDKTSVVKSTSGALKFDDLRTIDLIIIDEKRTEQPERAYKRLRQQLPNQPILIITSSDLLTNDELLTILTPSYTPELLLSSAIELILRTETNKTETEALVSTEQRYLDLLDNGKGIVYEEALKLTNEELRAANERAEKRYHQLANRISTLAQILAAARDTSLVFHTIVEFIKEHVPCETIVHASYDQDTNQALPHFLWADNKGIQTLLDTSPLELQNGAAGLAVLKREIVVSNNVSSQAIHEQKLSFNPHQNGHQPLLSIMTVPMCIGPTVIGLLELQTSEAGAYTQEQKTPIATAANLGANAIENIRLINRDREREQQLYQAQRIESIGRLAAQVAHDFNNIITAIMGNSDLAKKALPTGNPGRNHLSLIEDSCVQAKAIAGQILSFSRKRKLESQTQDLNKFISNKISNGIKLLVGEDIIFDTNYEYNLPLAHIDPNQMEQILMNLALNAKDAMPTGGTITITTTRLNPGHPRHSNMSDSPEILLTVCDTGTGMDQETQKHIFTPFYTTKPEGRGTGLGLSMAQGSIEQHGGTISVTSKLGEGTTFYIQLPSADGLTQTTETPAIRSPRRTIQPKNSETILVAEDHDAVRITTIATLRHQGFAVLEARDGIEALQRIKENPDLIDLLLTDLLMPRMSGRDLAREAQELSPKLKVLYMSGFNNDFFTEQAEAEAKLPFLQKPFTNVELLDTINQTLHTEHYQTTN